MNLLLMLFFTVPQDYVNMLMEGEYDSAAVYCDVMIHKTKGDESAKWQLEKGDVYYAKMLDLDKALPIYQELIDKYQTKGSFWIFSRRSDLDLGYIYLRLAQTLEMKEDYLNAAKAYETIATQFRKFPSDSFALNGVERCFKKNYQDYVATIDGYNITRLELDEKIGGGARFGKRDEKSVLDQMITERLIYENAVKLNIKETDFFKQNIAKRRRALLLDEVRMCDIISMAIPSEQEIKKYYKKNKENYKLHEDVKGKEIVVESDSIVRFLSDTLNKNIGAFDTLAKLYSTVSTRATGGNMGVVNRGAKAKAVDTVLFGLPLNKLSNIVAFDNKFGLYLVTEHRPERYREYNEVKTQIETALKGEKTKEVEAGFLKRLHDKAKIEMNTDTATAIDSTDQEKIMASVNGRKILYADLAKRNELQPMLGKVNLEKPAEREKLLKTMIDEELQLERAERQRYFLNDGYFTKLNNEITNFMDRGLYMKVVVDAISADSQDVAKYYDEHKEEFKVPEAIRGQEIAVNSYKLANELRQIAIKNPEKFDSLARANSKAPTKTGGGDTGYIRRGMRSKQFEGIAFNLKVGSISKVVSLDDTTYTFIKIIEHNPSHYQAFADVRPRLEANLVREQQRKVADEFLTRIRQDADIKIFLAQPEKEGESKENPEEKDK